MVQDAFVAYKKMGTKEAESVYYIQIVTSVQFGGWMKSLRVVPRYLLNRTVGAILEVRWIVAHHRLPLRLRHFVLAHVERIVDRDLMRRLLIRFAIGRAHHEAAQCGSSLLRFPGFFGRNAGVAFCVGAVFLTAGCALFFGGAVFFGDGKVAFGSCDVAPLAGRCEGMKSIAIAQTISAEVRRIRKEWLFLFIAYPSK